MTCDEMARLAERLGLGPYELMVVADGSGTTATNPCGWHYVAHNRPEGEVYERSGGATAGSSNFAELIPFVHALWEFQARLRRRGPLAPIHLVSDSEVTVRCGQGRYSRQANMALWAAIDWFVRCDYVLTWTWVPRNSNDASKRADAKSRAVRLALEKERKS